VKRSCRKNLKSATVVVAREHQHWKESSKFSERLKEKTLIDDEKMMYV
jgi:hypothetical protein